jgi:protein phosphatase
MKIKIPEFCILALVGVSGSGKTTFARKHFKPTETLSSDYYRALVCDDEMEQSVSTEAFELLYQVAAKRMAHKKLTVIDATNVQENARTELLRLAKTFHCFAVAIVLNVPTALAMERNVSRPERPFGAGVINRQAQALKKTLRRLKDEGFRFVYILNSQQEIDELEIIRERLWTNRENESGPFDIIGDIHGCYAELKDLLTKLGYTVDESKIETEEPMVSSISINEKRTVIFLGDLVDRGPQSSAVLTLVMNMVRHKQALCIAGNHEARLLKFLLGRKVQLTHGLQECVAQLNEQSLEFRNRVKEFLNSLISHYVLDQGRLVVSHSGLKEELQGRSSAAVREFALYGETTGEVDDYGLPVRANWAMDYRGRALVVYGHTPVVNAEFYNNTICIDTACVFGGKLTALRYPEKTLISVKAQASYYQSSKPLVFHSKSEFDSMLRLNDTIGKKRIETQLLGPITIAEENANAALEVMSRFAIDPRWLIYLPPTMAPTDVNKLRGDLVGEVYESIEGFEDERFHNYLEYPTEAIYYFKKKGVKNLILEEKHMGSRAIMVVCKDEIVPEKRFKIFEKCKGVIYTRTGRPFFADPELEQRVLALMQAALTLAGFWARHNTDWVCLDTEIMPWSFKAVELLQNQYAAVGCSASFTISKAFHQLEKAKEMNPNLGSDFEKIEAQMREAQPLVERYIEAYRRYCWPFKAIDDLKVAPFHILATEGNVHTNKTHLWHLEEIGQIHQANPKFIKFTSFVTVEVDDFKSIKSAVEWWHNMTNAGGEGCVVKSLEFTTTQRGKLLQPMIKCRGREYLRIIYGPTYSMKEKLEGLVQTRSVARKRRLALSEFALGVEALSRFVNYEPLWKIHECVFGILALESEPIDPRL